MSTWRYDPGDGRKKHAWSRDEAGFEPLGRGPVGKCPVSITPEEAGELLNEGLPVYEDGDEKVPVRIYNVRNGVIYESRRTEYGKSFHGFPWRGDRGFGPRIQRVSLTAFLKKYYPNWTRTCGPTSRDTELLKYLDKSWN